MVRIPRRLFFRIFALLAYSVTEPVDDVLPPPKATPGTGSYPLAFEFSDPVPLPPAKRSQSHNVEQLGQHQLTFPLPEKVSKTNGNVFYIIDTKSIHLIYYGRFT